MPRKSIELLRRNPSGDWSSSAHFWNETNTRGEFTFDGLPDGDYLLGYGIRADRPSNYSPYPTTYYPGVADRASATVLRLAPKQAIHDLRIPLPKPHTPRKIHVEVVWPDGRVPAHNLLQLFDGSDLLRNVGGVIRGRPLAPHNGIVDFTGWEERHYNLSIRYWGDDLGGPVPHDQQRLARSEVVHLSPGTEPASVKLILTKVIQADTDW